MKTGAFIQRLSTLQHGFTKEMMGTQGPFLPASSLELVLSQFVRGLSRSAKEQESILGAFEYSFLNQLSLQRLTQGCRIIQLIGVSRVRKKTQSNSLGYGEQMSQFQDGAAEEAGLMVGDYVLAVNGTDVTSIPHSEAADLARQGPDVLTLTIGSDIARGPNTPRPACRGYLHKRTQSGLIKGWRKRWFVLTHDCCLYYYRHKRDEGKRQALSAVKLEGADVGPDISLGKPFVMRCRPQSGNRVYFFCATSNQEMKRWLEAMEKAIHPITQNHVWVDVTRHNSNLPPLAVKNPDCLGLLHKMDRDKDMWLQHYCILKDGCLYMYSGIRATHALGGIYLHGYMVREQPFGFKKSTIELKPPSDEFKTFYLCAENPNENKRWIIAIKASIKKWLPLHQALQDYINGPPEETRM
ncbi:uncharacterized protein pdzph1 [Thunnus maccoyii]|uniref:uncharacterized protein pdzph1 n=1 Tax=Thunnus maccoyii TaxID=8240 RepID=UPI001C4B1E79|nr:uncharacterized protein pdzph1 [Thunnus maccoyii]